jgi:hypothetical protein
MSVSLDSQQRDFSVNCLKPMIIIVLYRASSEFEVKMLRILSTKYAKCQ